MTRLLAWLLNALYLIAIFVTLPWLVWSAVKHGKYREGFAAKLWGQVPQRLGGRPCVWLHAVSVGEVNLLSTVIDALKSSRPEWEYVISTTTKTGYELAQKKYVGHTVFYCPLDFSWATQRAMRRMRPALLLLAELELWPNLIQSARSHGARIAIVNGRLSDSSMRGYRRLRPLVVRVLRQVDLIAAQNKETADRFLQLGAKRISVHTTGSLKFDGAQTDRRNGRTCALAELAGLAAGDVVLLAGSTRSPEEAYAISIYQKLLQEYPRLKLVLVPRHPQRFDEVADLLKQSGLAWTRRSKLESHGSAIRNYGSAIRNSHSVILIDTVGELSAWWGLATVGFVGGSFGSRGGQNMLEPAAYGVATCFGPNTRNFRDIVSQLLAADGAKVVNDRDGFEQFVRHVLEDPEWAEQLGKNARALVLAQQGATQRTVEMLLPLVKADTDAPRLSAA